MYNARTKQTYHLPDVEELVKYYHYTNRINDWDTWTKVEPRFDHLSHEFTTNSVLELHDSGRYSDCAELSLEGGVLRYCDDCTGCRCGHWANSPCICGGNWRNIYHEFEYEPTFDSRFTIVNGELTEQISGDKTDPLELLFALSFRKPYRVEAVMGFFIDAEYPILDRLKELGRSKGSLEEHKEPVGIPIKKKRRGG